MPGLQGGSLDFTDDAGTTGSLAFTDDAVTTGSLASGHCTGSSRPLNNFVLVLPVRVMDDDRERAASRPRSTIGQECKSVWSITCTSKVTGVETRSFALYLEMSKSEYDSCDAFHWLNATKLVDTWMLHNKHAHSCRNVNTLNDLVHRLICLVVF